MIAIRASWFGSRVSAALSLALAASAPLDPPPVEATVRGLDPPVGAGTHPARSPRQMVPAEALRIVDGDTVDVRAAIWLDQHVAARVRLRGIDAPEAGGRCPEEARMAEAARRALERALEARPLFLTDIGRDKYGGRVVARIVTRDGRDVGEALLDAGLVKPYAGGRRQRWCA